MIACMVFDNKSCSTFHNVENLIKFFGRNDWNAKIHYKMHA